MSHLFFLHERVSLSTTASCHLAGFLLALQSTPPLLISHFCSKARRVHYIHRRVLRWCKGIMIFARSCCITSVCLVWCTYVLCTYVYVFVFLNFTCTWQENLSPLHASDFCIFWTSGLIFAKSFCSLHTATYFTPPNFLLKLKTPRSTTTFHQRPAPFLCFRFTIRFDTSSLPPPLKLDQPFQYQSSTYLPHHLCIHPLCSYNTWLLQKLCLLHDEDNNTGTLEDGCTGDLRLGQVIVKRWDDPFLHAQCAKKQWREKVGAVRVAYSLLDARIHLI